MAVKTLQEQLESVQAAIEAIEGGAQEYWSLSRKVTKADLGTLYKRETDLKRQIGIEANGFTTLAKWG